jgi:GYF domain 2
LGATTNYQRKNKLTDTIKTDEAWFYALGGQRLGPVSADELRELLATQTIDGETAIWRKGMADWQPLGKTDIGARIEETPPPIHPNDVNNGFVWALAVAPIAYIFVQIAVIDYQALHLGEDVSFSSALIWLIPALANATLCILDEKQLKHAGYNSGWMTLFALLLAPVYLFMRAQRLRQTPSYGYVWIASFIVSIIMRGA